MHTINKTVTIACIVVSGLILSSCQSMQATPKKALRPATSKSSKPDLSSKTDKAATKTLGSSATSSKKQPTPTVIEPVSKIPKKSHTESEQYPATDKVISGSTLTRKKNKTTGTGSYTLNFNNADLAEVAKTILSDSLGVNYVLSPEVKGNVTLQTTQAITKEELLPTLEMVLRMNNAALVKDGNIYHIESAANALYSSELSIDKNIDGYQTKVIPVRNVAAEEIAKLLKPLVKEKTILQIDNERNIIVASGTGEEMQRVLDMVSAFDTDVLKGRSFALFTLEHVEPETVVKELEAVFDSKGGEKEAAFFSFIPIERLNAILAITHKANYLDDIENWINRLDKANAASGGTVNVYRVQHVDAVELAGTLNEIFTSSAKKSKAASVAPGQEMAEISSKAPSPSASPQATGETKVSDVGEVKIIADDPNNSLVIVATAQEYERILPVIAQLDVMPLQVLIDVTIVEVDLKNDLKYGMQWSFDSGNFHNLLSNISSGNLKDVGPVTGYSLFYSGGTAKAVLNALAQKSTINVIASPSLMVLNNQEAFMNVGDKVPIATSQSTNNNSVNVNSSILPTGNDNVSAIVSNNIQMQDTGIILKIKPRVNAGGLVLLKIEQDANQAVPTTTSSLNSPTIQQRKINSSIAVKNGDTIVLGGLIREDSSDGLTGIPIMSEIPVLGSLFGTTSKNKNKTELVILITPRVVENENHAKAVTDEFKRKLTGIYKDSPLQAQ